MLVTTAASISIPTTFASLNVFTADSNEFVNVSLEMTVPSSFPTVNNLTTLFLWPGLQPLGQGHNFMPIDNGVLQPVLTWGYSCAPNQGGIDPYQWWISGQYVNTFGNFPGYMGCLGGNVMPVSKGDTLSIIMQKLGTYWVQTVTSKSTKQFVTFTIDMKNQSQGWFELVTELTSATQPSYVPAVTYKNVKIITKKSQPGLCESVSAISVNSLTTTANWEGKILYEIVNVTGLAVSKDNKTCTMASVNMKYSQTNPAPNLIHSAPFYSVGGGAVLQAVCNLNKPLELNIQSGSVQVTFVNDLSHTVSVFWYNGSSKNFYTDIAAGSQWSSSTFFGDRWVITASGQHNIQFSITQWTISSEVLNLNLSRLKTC